MTIKATLILPDIQYPYCDKLMLQKVLRVVKDIQPDTVLSIGDGIDFPQVSRWSIGTAGAYAPTLQAHIDGFRNDVLIPLREHAPTAELVWVEGNHDLRIRDFIGKYAPPLRTIRALEMESLFGLDDLNVQYEHGPIRVGTNTYAIHGHENGTYVSTPHAWDQKFVKRYGSEKNFVFGHTHQPFLTTRATGFNGKVSPWFTMNAGSIMDPTEAKYAKDGSVSWTMSFALLRDDGKRVWPELVIANNRQFWVNGEKY
ncbi:MAG TPA: metallophosphoesterase [Candidatus Paceibacterota bacterium]